MTKITLTREELYELVWSKPVIHIAKEYGFSDNGIRKICKKHDIPLPKSGYWSKLKFNKKVDKIKLPKQNDSLQISLEKTNNLLYTGAHPLSELALRKKEIEETKGLSLTVPSRLSNAHKYTLATKTYQEKLFLRNKTRNWNIELNSRDVLSINVSEKLLGRALRFMDTLVKVLEKRGYQVKANNKTEVVIKEQTYSLRLTEKNRRVKRETNHSWDSYDFEPTGNMCLKIDRSYPIKEWSDSKSKFLEERLVDILAWLELRAKRDEQEAIEWAIRHKQYEEQRKREEELQKLKDKELAMFESLFHTATRWHKSQYLRNYIKEFEQYAIKSNTLDLDKEKWIKWAKEKADWFDPFIEKEVELLKDIDRDTLKPKKKSFC